MSVALEPRTRPSVPAGIHQRCPSDRIRVAKTYRPWQCNGRCSHPNVAAIHQYGVPEGRVLGVLTATSRTSLLPPLSVVKALRIAGSCSVSNLTAMDVSSWGVDAMSLDCSAIAKFSEGLTVDDGTCLMLALSPPHHQLPIVPMTWWIFPSRAASVEAKRTACFWMGAKARAAWVGLTERKDRWNWLHFIGSAGVPSSIGFSGVGTHLLNIV